MKSIFLALLAGVVISHATDKPTVYNHITSEGTAIDSLVAEALAPKFTITNIHDPTNYADPRITAGKLPRVARTPSGQPLGGYVLAAYVVSADGQPVSPIILKTDDERLNKTAIKAIEEFRFHPATLNGTAVATTAAQEFVFETAPTEFITQLLEPIGGKILRPKDWFYAASQHGPTYLWIISRENASGGKGYTTGFRIQTFTGVKNGAGKSAEQFIRDFVDSKKKEAAKVIKTCAAEDQGLFTRICLETEEGQYHILYSAFWGNNNLDTAIVTTAGTTKELWDVYAPAFDKMSAFELVDMNHSEKAGETNHQSPIDGLSYQANWHTYSPSNRTTTGIANNRVQNQGIRLLSTQEEFGRNINVSELADFIRKMGQTIDSSLGATNEAFELLVQTSLAKEKKPFFQIATKGEVSQEVLARISESLGQLADYRTKQDEVKYEVQFKVPKKP